MTQKISWYVAGPWADRPFVREVIAALNAAGYPTTSRWADPDNPDVAADDPEREQKLRAQAIRDIEDVVRAEGLIYVNSRMSEGKATELGMSIASLKPIIIIGDRANNIFLHLNIPAFPTVEDALAWMEVHGDAHVGAIREQRESYKRQVVARALQADNAHLAVETE